MVRTLLYSSDQKMEALQSYSDDSDRDTSVKDSRRKAHRKSTKRRSRSRSPVKQQEPENPGSVHKVTEKVQKTKALSPYSITSAKFQSMKEKRKRLWQSKREATKAHSTSHWENVTFTDDDDGTQAKFRRLMGMSSTSSSTDSDKSHESNNSRTLKKLEQQYESSRYLTHVARGVGLGFGTTNADNNDLV